MQVRFPASDNYMTGFALHRADELRTAASFAFIGRLQSVRNAAKITGNGISASNGQKPDFERAFTLSLDTFTDLRE